LHDEVVVGDQFVTKIEKEILINPARRLKNS
jgi:hypothetical protein